MWPPGKGLRLDAFEQYIRGITEPDQAERLRHLQQAVKLSPDFGPAWMALGREDYSGQQYEQAAAAFAKVDRNDPDALEAGFYRGLSLLFSGNYPQAEEAFSGVARELPLAEVVNNQGVAISRQGHDGSALFRKAVAADPDAADYHFNLAVSLKSPRAYGRGTGRAGPVLETAAQRQRGAGSAEGLERPAAAARADRGSGDDAKADPLERIVRTFDAVAFRQAALMMDQMEVTRLAALSPHERALKLAGQAKEYLDRGLLLESERLYQSAVAADGNWRRRTPDWPRCGNGLATLAGARKEAQAALALETVSGCEPGAGPDGLAANHLDEAGREAGEALQARSRQPGGPGTAARD